MEPPTNGHAGDQTFVRCRVIWEVDKAMNNITCGEMGKGSNAAQTPNGLFGCVHGHGFAHMSAFGGHFARLAVILEQDFVRCPEYRGGAIRRLEMYYFYGNSNLCIGE